TIQQNLKCGILRLVVDNLLSKKGSPLKKQRDERMEHEKNLEGEVQSWLKELNKKSSPESSDFDEEYEEGVNKEKEWKVRRKKILNMEREKVFHSRLFDSSEAGKRIEV